MEKIPENQICEHMLRSYKKLFKAKYKKPKVGFKPGFDETEHYKRIVNLNSKILDYGSIHAKQNNPFNPVTHPVYHMRSTITQPESSEYLRNLTLKHPKYIPTYITFLKK